MNTCIVDSSMEMNVEQKIQGEVTRRECNTSDVSFVDIPEEIQLDILSRLPPKSLSRCQYVSKHWNHTLTIQAFFLKHSRSYDKHSKLAYVARFNNWRNGSVISFDLNDDNTPKTAGSLVIGRDVYFADFPMTNYFHMSNICNDLICLFDKDSTFAGLINIKTRDFIRLPAITIKSEGPFRLWYALGFDPVHKVFKVLSIIYESTIKEGTTTRAAILTVGSKHWNPINYKCLPSSLIKKSPRRTIINSLCLDEVIYWVHKNTIDNVSVLTVGSFDLNREAFRDTELVTTPMKDWTFRYYLTFLKECPTLFICKMKNYYTGEVKVEQWTLFNHKNPNAAWKRRIFTTTDFPKEVTYGYYGIPVAGGSTVIQYSKSIDSNHECSWYLSYDLEDFAVGFQI
ncbi:putative F-box protein At3g52320 [Silene latifolia]|uniref:putative F-box protein At3g52320 n=1 Tax=Silene latifolia TaxID=37657 RepID=UPI003D76F20A